MAIRYLSGINVDSNTLFVDSTNNRVGIGTGSPGFKLTVVGGNGNQLGLDNAGERFTQISFLESGSQNSAIWLDGTDNMFDMYANTGHGIRLKTGGDNPRLIVTSGGNVLIGTTTDAGYKLDVNGVGRFSSGVQVPNGQYFQTIRNSGGLLINLLGIDAGTDNTRLLITGDFDIRNGSLTSLMNMTAAGTTTFSASQLIIANANASVYFTTGSADYGNGSAIGRASTNGFHIGGSIAGDLCIGAEYGKGIIFGTGASGTLTQRMKIDTTGSIRFNSYGSGSFTGTATYGLAVDSSGNIIEVTSTLDGSGTANYVTKWQDSNTLTNSVIYDNGTNVGIGTLPTQGVRLQVAGSVDVWSSLNTLLRLNHDGTRGVIESYTGGGFSPTALNPSGGNVLVGTTSDVGHLLYVNGTSRFNGVIHGASRLMVGITSDQTYASIFVGGDITTGGSQYALLLDPQLSGTNNYGLLANARIKASHAATNAYGVYIVNNETLSGASIVNNYGLYIADQTRGSSVNYALYSAGGTSYFAGNVLIGTTTDSGEKMTVYGASEGAMIFQNSTSGTGAGNGLYLGTLNAENYLWTYEAQPLIFGTNNNEQVRITSAGHLGVNSAASSVFVLDVSSTDTAYNTRLYQPSTATDTYVSLILSGAMTSAIGYIGTGGSTAGNVAFRDNVVVGSQSNHPLVFNTNDGERGRFTAGGNLLIGTTTDGGYKLRVNGTGRYDDYLQFWSGTAGASPRLIFGGETSSTDKSIFLESYYMVFQGHNNEGFKFQTTSSLGAVSNRMSILGNGTVVLSNYGSGSKTGTVAYNLAVDASGNVIETAGGVVDGSGTANYVTKWQDANTVTNSQIVDNGTNVGINNASPKTKLDVNGTIGFGSKTLNISDTFVTVLTVNMSNHTGCYVKITAFGDWSGHSAVAYLGEFFLQNGASAYNEPGVIIRQVDNTNTDDVVAQIVDPAGTGTRDFEIQLKTTSASGVPFSAAIQYEIRGQYNSVS